MRRDDHDLTNEDEVPPGESERAIDLTALRGAIDRSGGGRAARLEALARRIEAAAAPELARRRIASPDLALFLARARRPALVAAAAAAMFAVMTARLVEPDSTSGAEPQSVAQALRVDEPAATWLVAGRSPSTADLAREIGLEELAAGGPR